MPGNTAVGSHLCQAPCKDALPSLDKEGRKLLLPAFVLSTRARPSYLSWLPGPSTEGLGQRGSCSAPVVVVQAAEDGESNDGSPTLRGGA